MKSIFIVIMKLNLGKEKAEKILIYLRLLIEKYCKTFWFLNTSGFIIPMLGLLKTFLILLNSKEKKTLYTKLSTIELKNIME